MADDSGEIVKESVEAAGASAILSASSVNDTNRKVTGELTSFYAGQQMAMSNAAMQNSFQLGTAITGKVAEMLIESTASEGKGADVEALLSLAKSLQSVVPVPPNQP